MARDGSTKRRGAKPSLSETRGTRWRDAGRPDSAGRPIRHIACECSGGEGPPRGISHVQGTPLGGKSGSCLGWHNGHPASYTDAHWHPIQAVDPVTPSQFCGLLSFLWAVNASTGSSSDSTLGSRFDGRVPYRGHRAFPSLLCDYPT